VLYRLPWPEGRSFMFTQVPGGWIGTHVLRSNRYAVDIAMPEGTPVLAARRGVVIGTEWRHGGDASERAWGIGNYVLVRHGDGTVATYAHLAHAGVAVEPGEEVPEGRLLGYSGTTGFSSGPHLHFGVSRFEYAQGQRVEVSLPVRFYVGSPPVPVEPRSSLTVTAEYSRAAELPRATRDARRLVEFKPPVPSAEELPWAWTKLGAWLALGLAGLAWFWRFSRD
jgi:murein DD-endopeptidase MepM/ murein hydrolase activator NlpD